MGEGLFITLLPCMHMTVGLAFLSDFMHKPINCSYTMSRNFAITSKGYGIPHTLIIIAHAPYYIAIRFLQVTDREI